MKSDFCCWENEGESRVGPCRTVPDRSCMYNCPRYEALDSITVCIICYFAKRSIVVHVPAVNTSKACNCGHRHSLVLLSSTGTFLFKQTNGGRPARSEQGALIAMLVSYTWSFLPSPKMRLPPIVDPRVFVYRRIILGVTWNTHVWLPRLDDIKPYDAELLTTLSSFSWSRLVLRFVAVACSLWSTS